MLEETLTIQLPRTTYRKLKRAAEMTYRSVDEVLAATIDATLIAPADLPPELADELAAMRLLSDKALWAAVRPSLSPAEQFRLEQINHTAGERTLTGAEEAEQITLLTAYYRSALRRAQALAILAQRGHPIHPALLVQASPHDEPMDPEAAA
ncbi:MAG: hypothetical protein AB1791_09645 [Chloroflexota bacterium]